MKNTRFDKKTMIVGSAEYEELLQAELGVWSKYISSQSAISTYDDVKKTHSYVTYRKGTIELELEYIKNLGEGIDVLELGSADGWLTNEILKLPNVKSVTSIDIALEENKKRYSDKAEALKGDLNRIEAISFTKKFHCIITHGTLHHLVDPQKTLTYCIDNLLLQNGILIINDTWILESIQLRTNAFIYTLLNKIPKAILSLNIKRMLTLLTKELPHIAISTRYAESIAHAHETSPFESISSAEDYNDIYNYPSVEKIFFRTYAALPGLQNAWMSSPLFIKRMIQALDSFFLATGLFCGDFHISILKKK